LRYFWSCLAPDSHQCRAEGGQEVQLRLALLGSDCQALEQHQAPRKMIDRFGMGRALERAPPGPLPVPNRRLIESRLCVMMSHQLTRCRGSPASLRGEHLGRPLMVLLSRALQERLIGGILDERMLEDIPAVWWQTELID